LHAIFVRPIRSYFILLIRNFIRYFIEGTVCPCWSDLESRNFNETFPFFFYKLNVYYSRFKVHWVFCTCSFFLLPLKLLFISSHFFFFNFCDRWSTSLFTNRWFIRIFIKRLNLSYLNMFLKMPFTNFCLFCVHS